MSWQFARLLNITDSFKKGLRWDIGNGNNINFWNDLWLGDSTLQQYASNENNQMKISDFLTQNRNWNIDKLKQYLPPSKVTEITQQKNIPLYGHEDKLIWTSAPDGKFSVKLAKKTI